MAAETQDWRPVARVVFTDAKGQQVTVDQHTVTVSTHERVVSFEFPDTLRVFHRSEPAAADLPKIDDRADWRTEIQADIDARFHRLEQQMALVEADAQRGRESLAEVLRICLVMSQELGRYHTDVNGRLAQIDERLAWWQARIGQVEQAVQNYVTTLVPNYHDTPGLSDEQRRRVSAWEEAARALLATDRLTLSSQDLTLAEPTSAAYVERKTATLQERLAAFRSWAAAEAALIDAGVDPAPFAVGDRARPATLWRMADAARLALAAHARGLTWTPDQPLPDVPLATVYAVGDDGELQSTTIRLPLVDAMDAPDETNAEILRRVAPAPAAALVVDGQWYRIVADGRTPMTPPANLPDTLAEGENDEEP